MNELTEKDLELVISKEELGVLETNALAIKEKVMQVLPNYSVENYSEANIDIAKKDKALLNKSAKALNDKRIEIEKNFNKPFEVFKTTIKETTDLIKEASNQIDEVVKGVENREKGEKKALIQNYFDEQIKELKEVVTLDKIFEDRWLNKTVSLEKVQTEVSEKINKIRDGLIAIGKLDSKYEVELKNDFLSHFDLIQTISKKNELEKNEELLKTQQEDSEKIAEEIKEEKMVEMSNTVVEEKVTDDILTYTLRITGNTSQMWALKNFLQVNNMPYEKVVE